MRRLGVTIPFHEDETVMSFLERVGRANLASSTREFCVHMGISLQKIRREDPVEIENLLALAGLFEPIGKRFVGRDGTFFEINGERLSKSSYKTFHYRYCPECLSEDMRHGEGPLRSRPYDRLYWHVSFIRLCPVHHRPLVRGAPRHEYGPDEIDAIIADVDGDNGRDSGALLCASTSFEQYVTDRLWARRPKKDWIDSLPLYVAGKLSELVGATILFGKHFVSKGLDDRQWVQCGQIGFELLEAGEDAFRDFIRSLHRDQLGFPKQLTGSHLYGRIYIRLNSETQDPGYDGVRQIIRDVALTSLPLGPRDVLFGPITERKFHSIRTACREFDVDPETLKTFLMTAGLIPLGIGRGEKDSLLFDAEEVTKHVRKLKRSLPTDAAMAHLGVTRSHLAALIKAGYLRPTIEHGENGIGYFYSEDDLDGILERLSAVVEVGSGGDVSMRSLTELVEQLGCSFREVIELVLSGATRTVVCEGEDLKFDAVFLDPTEIAGLLRRSDTSTLSMRDAEQRLRVNARTLRELIIHGFIKSPDVGDNVSHQSIPLGEIERFERRFTTLYKYARTTGRELGIVQRELSDAGIHPWITADLVGATFYRAADLPTK
jgi:hypothetical protein